jgi:hypothetical protein
MKAIEEVKLVEVTLVLALPFYYDAAIWHGLHRGTRRCAGSGMVGA